MCQSVKGHVRPSPGSYHFTLRAHSTYFPLWVCTSSNHPRSLYPQGTGNKFHSSGWLFWHKVHEEKYEDHLTTALKCKYEFTPDWLGSLYCSITLQWDYIPQLINISMIVYVIDALHKFQQPTPTIVQQYPHQWTPPKYGSTAPQMAHQPENSPDINPEGSNTV